VKRLEIRGLPADIFRGYLEDEFGGVAQADGTVRGNGWVARFIEGKPAAFRHGSVRVLFVEFEGPAEDEAAAFLARKAMRGGG
jgi:hypothetical protein